MLCCLIVCVCVCVCVLVILQLNLTRLTCASNRTYCHSIAAHFILDQYRTNWIWSIRCHNLIHIVHVGLNMSLSLSFSLLSFMCLLRTNRHWLPKSGADSINVERNISVTHIILELIGTLKDGGNWLIDKRQYKKSIATTNDYCHIQIGCDSVTRGHHTLAGTLLHLIGSIRFCLHNCITKCN